MSSKSALKTPYWWLPVNENPNLFPAPFRLSGVAILPVGTPVAPVFYERGFTKDEWMFGPIQKTVHLWYIHISNLYIPDKKLSNVGRQTITEYFAESDGGDNMFVSLFTDPVRDMMKDITTTGILYNIGYLQPYVSD